jgi:hypothetical protein
MDGIYISRRFSHDGLTEWIEHFAVGVAKGGFNAMGISFVTIPLMMVCGLLVPASSMGPTARADDEDTKVCTNHTLHGDYGFALEGEILGPGLQFRGVVMQHYDGKGNFTQVDHMVVNGVPRAERSGRRAAGPCRQSELHWISCNQGARESPFPD